MDFLESMLRSLRMTMEDGKITINGQGYVLLPTSSLSSYIIQLSDSKLLKGLYSSGKESMLEYGSYLSKAYKPSDAAKWLSDTVGLCGLGRITFDDPSTAPAGQITLENSPVAIYLKGRTKEPVDHIMRGIIAGVASAVSQKDLDAAETECYATGSVACKIMIDSKENLKNGFPKLYEQQIRYR